MIRLPSILVVLKRSLAVAAVVVTLAALPIVMQYLHLLDVKALQRWLEVFVGPYKVNATIVILLFFCLYVLFNHVFFALSATTVFCLAFSIVDMQKMRVLHQPLLPSDLFFYKQALFIARVYAGQALGGCMVITGISIGTYLLRHRFPRFRLPIIARLVVASILCAVIIRGSMRFDAIIDATNKRLNIVNEFWNQLSNYRKNGVLYGFLLNIKSLKIVKPPHYCKAALDRIFFYDSTTVALPEPPPAALPPDKPDVIVYMNESFWDITRISSIQPLCDPLPTFHSLEKSGRTIRLVSPTFGGNTCLAEFDILTGMPHGFLPPGSIAFNQYIWRPFPSLVRVFNENGYRTLALHAFKRWFWNRVNVYRHFGFDDFLSIESMGRIAVKGTFAGDEEFARTIVTCAAAHEEPHFIFALSMQNHGHYTYKRYDVLDCPVATGLSATADLEYNTFLQGIIDGDKSLKIIVEYVNKASKPTLLFFFGDHLPGFTHLYKESGYDRIMADNLLNAYMTTAVWHANFPLPPVKDRILAMVYFPLTVSRLAGIEIPAYYHVLEGVKQRSPLFSKGQRSGVAERIIPPMTETKEHDAALRMILYDALFGKQFADRYHHIDGPRAVAFPPD
ncbi:MAG: LTA synthase family protein [Chitinispirillaceae bacterium]|nr:LTA synthase family protein [Chitinispirillaceae bacterium]